MKNQIKELRVKIDGLSQLIKKLKPLKTPACIDATYTVSKEQRPNINSKEIEKAYDSLIFSKAWLGRVLLELEDTNPYAKSDGNRKTVKDIEHTANVNQDIHGYNLDVVHFEDKNYIEKVDWLKQEIKKVINKIKHLDNGMTNHPSQKPSREFSIARINAYSYVCEGRMWLSFELQRIKENN